MTIQVLAEKGQNHCEITRTLGVTKGAVRYRLGRLEEGARDGRKDKPFQAEAYGELIDHWVPGPKPQYPKRPTPPPLAPPDGLPSWPGSTRCSP